MFRWISGFIFFIMESTDVDVVVMEIVSHLSNGCQLCYPGPVQDPSVIPSFHSHLHYKWMRKKTNLPDVGWISTQDGVIVQDFTYFQCERTQELSRPVLSFQKESGPVDEPINVDGLSMLDSLSDVEKQRGEIPEEGPQDATYGISQHHTHLEWWGPDLRPLYETGDGAEPTSSLKKDLSRSVLFYGRRRRKENVDT